MADTSRAEELFARFLARDDGVAFEAWVAEHPDDAEALRALHARWRGFSPVLERLTPARSEESRVEELVRRLESRAPGGARFEERGEVGRGGMGRVLRVWDPDLERELALKIAREEPAGDDPAGSRAAARRGARFLAEARITGRLQHPGIVAVHELGLDDQGRLYYTMPLIEGEDLERVFERVRAGEEGWTRVRALGLLQRVCETMAHAHERGVVHGDLKPANVRVGRFGEVTVMDWGLARLVGEGGGLGEDGGGGGALEPLLSRVAGTPAYMAPEQALDPRAGPDPRADVYAVGAMLYRLLSGHVPHEDELRTASDLAAVRRVLERPPAPLHERAPDAAPELCSIQARAMAPVDERYASIADLGEDLRAFLEGRVVRAHATGALAELRKWVGRNRLTAAALAALVLSLGVGLTVSAVLFVQAARGRERVLRLADLRRHQELVARADGLWPARPERQGAYEAWLAEARALAGRLPLHRRTLEELRAGGVAGDDGAWVLPGAEAQWHHDSLAALVDELADLARADTGLIADVERRLDFARTVEERTRSGPEAREAWERVAAEVADMPAYEGLHLAPQLGLFPLGADPDSGLQEFAHVESGAIPERDGDGRLVMDGGSAIVLVLVPGGTFLMGAQADDPGLPSFAAAAFDNEAPPHEVTLAPYFIGKHELTQGQWLRMAGTNPSTYGPGAAVAEGQAPITLLHPVETIGRGQAARVLERRGLVLPTEARWEHAARAGTDTPWWTGDEPGSLQGAANLADMSVVRAGAQWPQIERWLDDGFHRHAPVDALAANPFGLVHVHGNVWEWCADDFGGYGLPVREGDGLRVVPEPGLAVGRGGGYVNDAAYSRSGLRDTRPDAAHVLYGVRVARGVE